MELKIQVSIRSVYGQERIYPVCAKAKLFAELAGQTTLSPRHITKIKQLGYAVEVVLNTKTL